jgi:ATP-binding cassette subfamily B multidrug efflux pump
VWRMFRVYGRPWLGWYAGGFVAIVATNAMAVEVPLVLARGIDALGRGDPGGAWRQVAIVGALAVAIVGARTASRLLFFQPGRFVEAAILGDLFRNVLDQDPTFFAKVPPGDVSGRVTSDLQSIRLLFGFAILGLVNTAVAVVVTTLQMVRMSPAVALLAAVPMGLAFLATMSAAARFRDLSRRVQEATSALADDALATFQGLATLRAYGAEDAAVARFSGLNDEAARANVERSNLRIWIGPVLVLAAGVDVWLALALGGPRAIAGELTVGQLVAFASLVGYLAGPLRGFTFTMAILRQSQASVERLHELLDARPARPELPAPAPTPATAPALSIRGLTVTWGDGGRPALDGVDVEIPAGSVLGVYGPTGSGKTTLVRALLRLVDPPPGTVFVDGVDVRSLDRDAWRAVATLVPQRAFLFSESIAHNVGFGHAAPEQIREACRRAQLDADLAALPDGLDTVVGEAGLTVSGGQRQRVALARGLLRPSTLLVLDDVLSAVDPATERALVEELRSRRDRPTTVLVSNRMSALVHADRVLVLDAGRKVDEGTHTELLTRPGPYRDAWAAQEGA